MTALQKNIGSQVVFFGLVNATTGVALAGATVSGFVTKDAGAQAAAGGTYTSLGNGQYKYAPTQAETNATAVGMLHTATSAIPVSQHFFTIGQDPTQAQLVANTTQINGTNQTARDLGASVLLSSGTGTGQISLSAGKVAEVVLVDTLTTYTGNTVQTGDAFARIGSAGVGLTNLGDTRIGNLDAAVSTRATPAQVLTTALTESYAALHAAPTLTQALLEVRGLLAEKSVTTTTLTVNGIDGATAKETFTLNSSTTPTAITRAT